MLLQFLVVLLVLLPCSRSPGLLIVRRLANLPLAFGVAGAVLVPLLTLRRLRAAPPSLRWFWIWLIAFTIPISIAVHGTEDRGAWCRSACSR